MSPRNAEEYVNVKWQKGTVPEKGSNGAQIVDVLTVASGRLLQLDPDLSDKYNKETFDYIMKARDAQEARTADRVKRGVEGTHEK
ncbi:hypothetical protein [Apilactobacillus timberlakei]|uniref:hypothetical protein n=1 Tax=Apilactobacillus timberlakei TaxID=2008380 RepID=UPI00112BD4BE|nr:hypothetical protein [Apilactobacillus timberlakei]TPR12274.1 hypothetical protein DYZ97_07280 [Apilactobacillus timberlakei]